MNNIYIGLMTGTSLDGVDTAICKFDFDGTNFMVEELFFRTYPYSDKIKDMIGGIISDSKLLKDVSQLNFALAKIYASCVSDALNDSGISKDSVKAIGLHGQTIWHQPIAKPYAGMHIASTFQAGSIPALSAITSIPVIGDFRSADIALGGQGAPLVPIFDYHFLKSTTQHVVALNIGGISNITYLEKECSVDDIIAFDTGPGNVLLDIASKKYFGMDYDPGGSFARQGTTDIGKLNKLMELEYIKKPVPKSTGREFFNILLFNKYFESEQNAYDTLNTLTHFTAKSIAENIRSLSAPVDEVIVSGGGARNTFLLELLGCYLPDVRVLTSEKFGIGTDSKEAVCFAFLAYLHDLGLPGNIPNATGSTKRVLLGIKADILR
ncbi:MAG: anhydro-N-acetylmuramic acid kinase [Candidatus Kapabacteria bacterium]|nr:anhydro-N-acetylmuramic acid kinase [Ignavibacteriota bacterium]MCW5884381.1 anhydro-N-acetylmuramic acid kinase [Candidatus Kapabacteria bacterium]